MTKESIKHDKDLAQSFFESGLEKFNEKDYYFAIRFFNWAIKKDSLNSDYYLYRGRAISFIPLNKELNHLRDYNKSIKLNPKNALAYYFRALNFIYPSKYAFAYRDFSKAQKLDFEVPAAYLVSAKEMEDRDDLFSEAQIAFITDENPQKALEIIDHAIKKYSYYGKYYKLRSEINLYLGIYEGALADILHYNSCKDYYKEYLIQAKILFKLKRYKEALELLNQIIENIILHHKDSLYMWEYFNGDYHLLRASIYEKLNDNINARKDLEYLLKNLHNDEYNRKCASERISSLK